MLCFQDASLAQRMCIVGKIRFVIISLHVFHRETFVPREGQILAISLEIIFHVALGTNQRTHLLRSSLVDVLSLTGKCFTQCRATDLQFHVLRFMAIGTADRVHDLITDSSPFIIIKRIDTDSLHHARYIGTLTSPASGRLRPAVRIHRSPGAQTARDILYGVHMPARGSIIFRESISCPENHHFGTFLQYIHRFAAVKLTFKISLCSLLPRVILTGIVFAEHFIVCFDAFDVYPFIVENADYLRPAFHQ